MANTTSSGAPKYEEQKREGVESAGVDGDGGGAEGAGLGGAISGGADRREHYLAPPQHLSRYGFPPVPPFSQFFPHS